MTKRKRKLLPALKKDIKDFLVKEDGSMVKKDVVKICLGVLAMGIGLKAGMSADPAQAGICCNGPACSPPCRPHHCSHSSHSSHSSY